jgi:hypothetical protein
MCIFIANDARNHERKILHLVENLRLTFRMLTYCMLVFCLLHVEVFTHHFTDAILWTGTSAWN